MRTEFAIISFFKSVRKASPALWRSSCVMVLGLMACLVLSQIDARLLGGVSVWEKPAKFFLSISVQAISIAFALSLLPNPAHSTKFAAGTFIIAGWFEITYMLFRASRAEASHFNASSTFAIIMYALMGGGAVSMTGASGFVGWRLWQQSGHNLMREAAALGLMLGALLGTAVGAYLGKQHSHWIGGDLSDASGLGFFHWSATGGDLRVAHFIGLHTTQILPLAALSGQRWVTYAAGVFAIIATIAAFVMAVMGVPVLAQ